MTSTVSTRCTMSMWRWVCQECGDVGSWGMSPYEALDEMYGQHAYCDRLGQHLERRCCCPNGAHWQHNT